MKSQSSEETALTLRDVLDATRKIEIVEGERRLRFDLALVERMAAQGMTLNQIAAFFGVSRSELLARKQLADELAKAVERGKSIGIRAVSERLLQQASEGNTIAAIFYLKTVAKWREADKLPPDGDADRSPVKIYLPEPDIDKDELT